MADLALGPSVPAERLAGAQTPGGTGAIHQLFELIRRANPAATVWHSDPTWPNHPAILGHLGMPARTYRYFDAATGGVDFAGMMADLAELKPGDVLLLHGCCHNPTGANLALDEWRELTDFALAQGAVPMIDLAYQGFGDGLDADVAGAPPLGGGGSGDDARGQLLEELRRSTATVSAPPSPSPPTRRPPTSPG